MSRTMTHSQQRRTMSDMMMDILHRYREAGGEEPIDLNSLAEFAIDNRLWQHREGRLLQLCKQDFAEAFRKQHHTDARGRQIRTFHAVMSRDKSERQTVFWGDIRSAPAEHMETAFQQRRNQIVGSCLQLKHDVESYNENNIHGGEYQLLLDFAEDVAEREQPVTHRPNLPR